MLNKLRHRGLNLLDNLNLTTVGPKTTSQTNRQEQTSKRNPAEMASFGNERIGLDQNNSGTGDTIPKEYASYQSAWTPPEENHAPTSVFNEHAYGQQAFAISEERRDQFAEQRANGGEAFKSLEEVCAEGYDSKDRIGPWQAGWNVTNAIQGMFIVSLPYAVLHGGWWGVFALAFVAYICYYTGLILIECLYDDQGLRIRRSYVDVAEACWGKTIGGRLVHVAQMIELLMTDILYIVLCGDLLEGCFPTAAMDKAGWMIFSSALLLSCAFLTSLRAVSWLSFWNTVSHVIINLIILIHCLTRAGHWAWSKVRWSLDINTFPTVLGIVVFSYTSHIFLPTLEGNMDDRTKFKPMLKWSHIAAGVFKALMGLVGFLTFGDYTQQEVTNNLPTQEFKTIINFILVIKALLSYPLPYYASAQLLEHALFKGKPQTLFPSCFGLDGSLREWALALRVCLVLFTLFMAISIPQFALLMGLIGSFTGCMLSFIWPCVFHLKLKRPNLPKWQVYWNSVIIGLGLFFGFIGIIYSSAALLRAMSARVDY